VREPVCSGGDNKLTKNGEHGQEEQTEVGSRRVSPWAGLQSGILAGDDTTRLAVAFTNDYFSNGEDRNLYVDWFEIEGPLDAGSSNVSETRARIMSCAPASAGEEDACARRILGDFAARAWRRPVTDADMTRLMKSMQFASELGDGFEEGIRLGLRTILLSPHFAFRPERPGKQGDEVEALSSHELATRLSYFLWSTMPDDELRQLADAGQLQDDDVLRQQVERMLADAKAVALIDVFATQWLFIDQVLEVTPDYEMFPDFDEELARAMRTETRMFATDVLLGDRDMRDLLSARDSFINERLATHYGVTGVTGDDFVPHTFADESRRGLLTHGSILTARSYPNRTSPVLRGVWVLEQLLCDAPPPPPPGVESIDDMMAGEGATLRERLEAHRSMPACVACHQTMDPIGFGLEHYDATGAWRDLDAGKPVDAFGELPDGRSFLGAYQMAEVLAGDPKFADCVAEKMLTYATGRGFENEFDHPQVHLVAERATDAGLNAHELITQVVLSDAFRKIR